LSQAQGAPSQQQQQQQQQQKQLGQQQGQQQLSFPAGAGAQGCAVDDGSQEQQSWFAEPSATQQQPQNHQQSQQVSFLEPPGGCSQSISLGHLVRPSQQHSEGRTHGSWPGAFGSQQPVDCCEGQPEALEDDGGAGGAGRAAGGGAAARVEGGAAPGGSSTGGVQAGEAGTPFSAWAERFRGFVDTGQGPSPPHRQPPARQQQQQHQQPQQQQQQHQHQQQDQQQRRPPQLHRTQQQRLAASQQPSPLSRSPLGPSHLWHGDGVLADSGSRAEAAGVAPLSEEDFVLKASDSYTRALAVTSPPAPGRHAPTAAAAGPHAAAVPHGRAALGRDGGGGRGGARAQGAAAVGCDDDYHTPLHPGSQVGTQWGFPRLPVGVAWLNAQSPICCTTLCTASSPPSAPRLDEWHSPPQHTPANRPAGQDQPFSDGGATRLSGLLLPGQCSEAMALTLTAEETTTPELECVGAASQDALHSGGLFGRGGEQEATTAQALFPIFRPRNQRKCIVLVRHGESSEPTSPRAWVPHQTQRSWLQLRVHTPGGAL
jgi:hypothetical protein